MSTQENKPDMALFWGCFIALITTAFAFITRAFLVNDPSLWPKTFGLDAVQAGELFGAGIWPFAISIIIFSLIIDRIGYKTAMWFSFLCYGGYAILALQAYGVITADPNAKKEAYNLLYWGSVILGLGNGTVEAYINPVVATMFNKDKSKWLNILHAAWPGGLVIGGVLTLALGGYAAQDWRILVYIIAAPALVYVFMLSRAVFPPNERVAAGTTYREMLAEFGILGAAIASYLITAQLAQVFAWSAAIQWSLFAAMVIGFGIYSRSLGRGILVFLCVVMIPLATTELGTDGAISGIMEKPMHAIGGNGMWVLIYTSAIMMVLRFFAGSIVSRISPLGLLAGSAVLAIVGLSSLVSAQTATSGETVKMEKFEVNSVPIEQQILPTSRPFNSVFGTDDNIIDVPRNVTIISRQQLTDISITDVLDFSKLTSSAFTTTNFGAPSNVSIRGQSADTFVNGVRARITSNGTISSLAMSGRRLEMGITLRPVDVLQGLPTNAVSLFGVTQQ